MLWAYDEAICKDLADCINPSGKMNSTVKMLGDDGIMGVLAQIEEDRVTFPAIFLSRHRDTPLDPSRFNFTRLHKGVPAAYNSETNTLYMERMAPIELKYDMHVLTTNTSDMDEVTRELLFRYSSMYYITMEVPYESKRKIRFGIGIHPDTSISQKRGQTEYVESGRLFESIMELECQGAVLLSYTPRHMQGLIVKDPVMKLGGEITLNNN